MFSWKVKLFRVIGRFIHVIKKAMPVVGNDNTIENWDEFYNLTEFKMNCRKVTGEFDKEL